MNVNVGTLRVAKQVQMTAHEDGQSGEGEDQLLGVNGDSHAELVSEEVAKGFHTAFMAFQDAKWKYREALPERGVDQADLKRRGEEPFRAAQAKSTARRARDKGTGTRTLSVPFVDALPPGPSASGNKVKSIWYRALQLHDHCCGEWPPHPRKCGGGEH